MTDKVRKGLSFLKAYFSLEWGKLSLDKGLLMGDPFIPINEWAS